MRPLGDLVCELLGNDALADLPRLRRSVVFEILAEREKRIRQAVHANEARLGQVHEVLTGSPLSIAAGAEPRLAPQGSRPFAKGPGTLRETFPEDAIARWHRVTDLVA